MALPPSTEVNETFLREVDENLRRDRARDFLFANRTALIVAVILFLAAAGGTIWYREHKEAQVGHQVEDLAKVYRQLGEGKTEQSAALKKIEDSGSASVAATARFTAAAINLETGKTKEATEIYRAIGADSDLPQPYRDIALIRLTALEFDKLKPEEVIARMQPLAKPGEPWFGSAGEMTALALIKQGEKQDAGRLFAAIARDKTAPPALRARSVQIASSLGVDASDALPTIAPASAQ